MLAGVVAGVVRLFLIDECEKEEETVFRFLSICFIETQSFLPAFIY